MYPSPEQYGYVLLGTVVPAIGLIWYVWDKRTKPGGRWLILTIVGMSGWSVSWGLYLLFDSIQLSVFSLNGVLWFVSVMTIGWAMMTLEFSQQRRYALRYVLLLFAFPLLSQLVAWTNPVHFLLWESETTITAQGVVQVTRGPWFTVHAGYNYLLMLFSGVLLVNDYFTLKGIYRKQALVMLSAWSIPVVTSAVFSFGSFPVNYLNPTPMGFLVGGLIWTWGLYHFRLFEIVPVARRRAFDQMDDAVVTIDEHDLVVDVNQAAVTMFSFQTAPTGKTVDEAFPGFPEVHSFLQNDESESSLQIESGGEVRYLSATKTTIGQESGSSCFVAVFKDMTELKRHERDLELLKQVFARVFRHDLSNDLNVIRAYGELLASETEGQHAEYSSKIVDTCDSVINTGKKARAIEKLVDDDRKRYDVDLVSSVERTVEAMLDQYPKAEIETDLPPEAWVQADRDLDLAIQCLVDNAIVHSEADCPWVRIEIETRANSVVLTVEDDGPGIRQSDRMVFEENQIDPLSHSSGLGLWTVDWVVKNSEGTVSAECTERGTKVVVTLEGLSGSTKAVETASN